MILQCLEGDLGIIGKLCKVENEIGSCHKKVWKSRILRTRHPRPYAVVWRAQHPNHYSELVYVVFSRENGGKIQKLPEDASHGPEIHGLRVLPGAIEQLRRPVPTRRNLVGIESIFFLAVENTAQAEVSNLQLSFGTVSKGEINLANSCN